MSKDGTIAQAIETHVDKLANKLVLEYNKALPTRERLDILGGIQAFLRWAFHNHKLELHPDYAFKQFYLTHYRESDEEEAK